MGDNPNRMHHIYVLTQDMQSAGIPLEDDQQLLAIEAMFIEGFRGESNRDMEESCWDSRLQTSDVQPLLGAGGPDVLAPGRC